MATKLLLQKTCDRCGDLIEEEERDGQAAIDAEDDKYLPLLVVEATGELERPAINYGDLCPKCTNRIGNLLSQIALDKPAAEESDDKGDDDKGADAGADEPPIETAPDEKPPKKGKGKGKGGRNGSEAPPPN